MSQATHPPSNAQSDELPTLDEAVECRGCERSTAWQDYDLPSEDVDALAACPHCGTYITGFYSEAELREHRQEMAEFLSDLSNEAADTATGSEFIQ